MKATKTVLLDTNIILRFLLVDQPEYFKQSKNLLLQAEKGMITCYIDSVVFAEIIWTLTSFYKMKRSDVTTKLEMLLAQSWMVNEHKQTLLSALHQYQETTLDYIDCWILAVSNEFDIPIETYDRKLLIHARSS